MLIYPVDAEHDAISRAKFAKQIKFCALFGAERGTTELTSSSGDVVATGGEFNRTTGNA